MAPETDDEYRVYLCITGYERADDVSRLVGVNPSRTTRKGVPDPLSGRPDLYDEWQFGPTNYSTDSIPVQLSRLLDAMAPFSEGVSKAASVYHAQVNCVGYLNTTINPELWLSSAQMTTLSALGLSIDFDLYSLQAACSPAA